MARILGVSRSTVSALEHAALRNIRLAEETIRAYKELLVVDKLRIPAGTHLISIPDLIVKRGDELGVRIKGDFVSLYWEIRKKLGRQRTRLSRDITILIYRDGEIEVAVE